MKLVLYGGGDAQFNCDMDFNLLSLTKKRHPKFVFVPSCHFHGDEDFSEMIAQYRPLGIKKIMKWDIDLPYSLTLKETAFESDIIYLGGGNTYYFLNQLRKENLLLDLKNWVLAGGVLAGLSAGAILMTKKIETAGFPSFDKDENEENLVNLSALDLVDFDFFPHYKNSRRYDLELKEFSQNRDHPLFACPDGSGIIISGNEIKFVGKTACFIQGKKFFLNKQKK